MLEKTDDIVIVGNDEVRRQINSAGIPCLKVFVNPELVESVVDTSCIAECVLDSFEDLLSQPRDYELGETKLYNLLELEIASFYVQAHQKDGKVISEEDAISVRHKAWQVMQGAWLSCPGYYVKRERYLEAFKDSRLKDSRLKEGF